MGKTLQRKDYVVLINNSWRSFEDTLLFFNHEIEEVRLREPDLYLPFDRAIGVPAASLSSQLVCREACFIESGRIVLGKTEKPFLPSISHVLHVDGADEMEVHRRLSRRIAERRIPMINPYNAGTAACDSKIRMHDALVSAGVATPRGALLSHYNPERLRSYRRIAEDFAGRTLYIQPDRGTEGRGCLAAERGEETTIAELLDRCGDDMIVREEAGGVRYRGKHPVFRINVCFDGEAFHADSGFCMIGDAVVSFERGGRRVDINDVFRDLLLGPNDIRCIRDTSRRAVEAVFHGVRPTLLTGVDLVIERSGGCLAYVLDINPRPVIVGSRLIGAGGIGLGSHYWKGVAWLCRQHSPLRNC